jgi:hypothetical protein
MFQNSSSSEEKNKILLELIDLAKNEELEFNERKKYIQSSSEEFNNLLEYIRNSIYLILKFVHFPRFLRSKFCVSILQDSLKQIPIHKTYNEDDFQIPIVTDEDIQFFKDIDHDNFNWNLIHFNKSTRSNTYFMDKQKNPFSEVHFMENCRIFKYESIIPFSLDDCCVALTPIPQVKKYNRQLIRVKSIDYLSYSELKEKYPKKVTFPRGNATFEIFAQVPPLIIYRKLFDSVTSYFENESFVRVIKPFIPKDLIQDPEDWSKLHSGINSKGKKEDFYIVPSFIQMKFTRISDMETKYSQIHSLIYSLIQVYSLVGSAMAEKFDKVMIISRSSNLRKYLIATMKEYQTNPKVKEEILNNINNDFYHRLLFESNPTK